MKYLVFGLLFACSSLVAQPLKSGDLLFVSSDASDFEQAISEVTNDELELNFSHVAMVNVTDSGTYVIEAAPNHGVVYRPISEFTQDNIEKIILLTILKSPYQQWTPGAIAYAYSHVGKPYNFAFDFNNDEFYCSELIYVAFAKASGNTDFFETPPMTFKPSEDGKYNPSNDADFLPFWVDYFAKLGIPIPEGKPGLNPNGMSRSEKLEQPLIPISEFIK
jgi:hypothetical protein